MNNTLTILVLLAVFCTAVAPVSASDIQLALLAGLMNETESHFKPAWGLAALAVQLQVNEFLILAPEGVAVKSFSEKTLFLCPGFTLNYKFGAFFFGAGLSKWLSINSDSAEVENPMKLKGHIGAIKNNFMITVFLYSSSAELFSEIQTGLLIGIVF